MGCRRESQEAYFIAGAGNHGVLRPEVEAYYGHGGGGDSVAGARYEREIEAKCFTVRMSLGGTLIISLGDVRNVSRSECVCKGQRWPIGLVKNQRA